jgi:hypothetical protein
MLVPDVVLSTFRQFDATARRNKTAATPNASNRHAGTGVFSTVRGATIFGRRREPAILRRMRSTP